MYKIIFVLIIKMFNLNGFVMKQVLLSSRVGNPAQKVVELGFSFVGQGSSVKRVIILTRNMTVSIPVYCEDEGRLSDDDKRWQTEYYEQQYREYLQAMRERRDMQREQDAE